MRWSALDYYELDTKLIDDGAWCRSITIRTSWFVLKLEAWSFRLFGTVVGLSVGAVLGALGTTVVCPLSTLITLYTTVRSNNGRDSGYMERNVGQHITNNVAVGDSIRTL